MLLVLAIIVIGVTPIMSWGPLLFAPRHTLRVHMAMFSTDRRIQPSVSAPFC